MRLRIIVALGIALGFGSGCAIAHGVDVLGWKHAFDDAQKRYTRLVRWAEYDLAAEYVDPEQRGDYLAQVGRLADLRFTDYEVRSRDLDMGSLEAEVVVTYHAYRVSSLATIAVEERQHWYRDIGERQWRVRSELEEDFAPAAGPTR